MVRGKEDKWGIPVKRTAYLAFARGVSMKEGTPPWSTGGRKGLASKRGFGELVQRKNRERERGKLGDKVKPEGALAFIQIPF